MPRRPRVHVERGTYYAVQNGATQRAVFASERDYTTFERMLADVVADGAIELHAYCLLPDHFHLALTLAHGTLAHAMQRLTSRYARYAQHAHGHFFRHRYRAVLIDPQTYLLELVRYLHDLPVRHNLSRTASDYAFSSDRVYRRLRRTPWISQRRTRALLNEHHTRYETWASSAPTPSEARAFADPSVRVLGSPQFIRQLPRQAHHPRSRQLSIEGLIRDVAVALEVTPQDLAARTRTQSQVIARALSAWLVVEHQLGSLTDMARRFNRDVSTLSKSIAHYRKRRPDLFRLDVLHHLRPLADVNDSNTQL